MNVKKETKARILRVFKNAAIIIALVAVIAASFVIKLHVI